MTSPAEEKRARALELRLAGATYSQIASAVGYADRGGAHRAVKQALADAQADVTDPEVADTELARLDAMLTGLWQKARKGDVNAVSMVLRIQERRAVILGALPAERNETPLVDEIAERRKRRRRKPIRDGASRES